MRDFALFILILAVSTVIFLGAITGLSWLLRDETIDYSKCKGTGEYYTTIVPAGKVFVVQTHEKRTCPKKVIE